jgi:hypothetical protein
MSTDGLSTDIMVCGQNCLQCVKLNNPNGDIYYKCATEENNDSSTIIIILVIVGVLVLLVSVIIIVIKIRRRNKFLSTVAQQKKIQSLDENAVNNNIEFFVSTKVPKTLMDDNAAFGDSLKHPYTGNGNHVNINKMLADTNKKRDSIIKHFPVSTNCRNIQPQQIVHNLIKEKNMTNKSKPVSEVMLQDEKLLINNNTNNNTNHNISVNASASGTPVIPRRRSLLKFNYKQLKQKEMSQFHNREYDLSSADGIQVVNSSKREL